MKLDLKLLSAHFARLEDEPSIPRGGVNDYLLDKILFPCMNGKGLFLDDIDFDAFEAEDVEALAEFYNKLTSRTYTLAEFVRAVAEIQPAAVHSRGFC